MIHSFFTIIFIFRNNIIRCNKKEIDLKNMFKVNFTIKFFKKFRFEYNPKVMTLVFQYLNK